MKKIELTEAIKAQLIYDLQNFFEREREEELGRVGAEVFLDFILKEMGPMFYNQALIDAHTLMTERIDDIYVLEMDDIKFDDK
jgi:uncharacterized protein (DUF2164 family)